MCSFATLRKSGIDSVVSVVFRNDGIRGNRHRRRTSGTPISVGRLPRKRNISCPVRRPDPPPGRKSMKWALICASGMMMFPVQREEHFDAGKDAPRAREHHFRVENVLPRARRVSSAARIDTYRVQGSGSLGTKTSSFETWKQGPRRGQGLIRASERAVRR